MKIKIEIETPKGQAKGTLKQFRWYFKLFSGCKVDAYCNKDDSCIYLECDGSIKQILQVQKNVASFYAMPDLILGNKHIKGLIKTKFPEATTDDFSKLEDMLKNGTKVTIIKEATAKEIVEADKSLWQSIKEKFIKVEE
jgi:hypothetical protein